MARNRSGSCSFATLGNTRLDDQKPGFPPGCRQTEDSIGPESNSAKADPVFANYARPRRSTSSPAQTSTISLLTVLLLQLIDLAIWFQ